MNAAKLFESNLSAAVVDLLYHSALSNNESQAAQYGLDSECVQLLRDIPPTELRKFARCLSKAIQIQLDPKQFRFAVDRMSENREREDLLKEMVRLDAPYALVSRYFPITKHDFAATREQLGISMLGMHKARKKAVTQNTSRAWQLTQFILSLLELKGIKNVDEFEAEDWLFISRQTGITLRPLWNTINDWMHEDSFSQAQESSK